jgi:hypothetical protein
LPQHNSFGSGAGNPFSMDALSGGQFTRFAGEEEPP